MPLIFFFEIIELPALVLLGFWFLMQLFSAGAIGAITATGDSGGIAFVAHVAGFAAGVVGVFVFRKRRRRVEWNDLRSVDANRESGLKSDLDSDLRLPICALRLPICDYLRL